MLTDEKKKNAKPLILNTQMVKAILDGRKTRFSKVVKKPIDFEVESTNVINAKDGGISEVELVNFDSDETLFVKPQYKVGDILYVKETFLIGEIEHGYDHPHENEYQIYNSKNGKIIYYADHIDNIPFNNIAKSENWDCPIWKPSTHLLKRDARIFLKITDSRLENLQDMSIQDIQNEGIFTLGLTTDLIHQCWQVNWDSTAKEGYKVEDEPLIFGFDFKRIDNEKE